MCATSVLHIVVKTLGFTVKDSTASLCDEYSCDVMWFGVGKTLYKHCVPVTNVVYNVFKTLGFLIKDSTASLCDE